MESLTLLICFWVFIALVTLFLLYDANRSRTEMWLAENDVAFPTYPWFVLLDHWIYHCECARVQNVIFEQHRFFGGRIRKLGDAITFTH